ncbi:putative ubiquitin-like protein smt3 protein [Botrytis fragariae]|uniref:Putative ubiquitin-like protein smt3 protein n=1 Tax=Botrytis fragariae TaxID=1964551 RepID=A0A8H6AMP7_9HELO|nr:putative ubiquitin-like protein smt3 protein [Botrytis fragariae]KAF5870199.1 putative ubiquitin-like protein smt3 protein [Botrytis fragariae]
MTVEPKDLSNTLSNLTINPSSTPSKPFSRAKKSISLADSWEDEASSGSDTETETDTTQPPSTENTLSPTSSSFPSAPPPTPISPPPPSEHFPPPPSSSSSKNPINSSSAQEFENPYGYPGPSSSSPNSARGPERRQEKTDAVARRLIAGALGVRAPKKTEEQREYERVQKEKEMKRRKEEREEEEKRRQEAEKIKKGVWDD